MYSELVSIRCEVSISDPTAMISASAIRTYGTLLGNWPALDARVHFEQRVVGSHDHRLRRRKRQPYDGRPGEKQLRVPIRRNADHAPPPAQRGCDVQISANIEGHALGT